MLSDQEAKSIVDQLGDLSPVERLAVRCVAKHETQYGAGWDAQHKPAPRPEFGAGSNNMGAVTTASTDPATYFVHTDSRFDPVTGKVVEYSTKFSKHSTPLGGFAELAQTLLFKGGQRRDNVAKALALGSLLELATAMRMNRYFLGVKPMAEAIEDYRSALERRYQEISTSTGENFFDAPAGPVSAAVGSGLGLAARRLGQSAPESLAVLSSSLPVLRRGVRGDLVGVMQFELGIDGDEIFGPKTLARLVEFQADRGIDEGGACGPKTWAALFALDPPTGGDGFDDSHRVGV